MQTHSKQSPHHTQTKSRHEFQQYFSSLLSGSFSIPHHLFESCASSYLRWKTLLKSIQKQWKTIRSVYFIYSDEELICILCHVQIGKSSPRTTSLCSASLAVWPEARDPTDGKELISFKGICSNSVHFFSISSSMRSFWFDPVPFLDRTASHWLLVFFSSCLWLCSLPCPSPASLWLARRRLEEAGTGDSST